MDRPSARSSNTCRSSAATCWASSRVARGSTATSCRCASARSGRSSFSDPAHIEEILIARHRDFVKSAAFRILSRTVGQGLVTSEGEVWLRQRGLIQPGVWLRERA